MSMSRPVVLAVLLSLAWAGQSAFAQETETVVRDRFFSDRVAEGEEPQVRGSITSSTYVAPELGDTATEGFAVENASPILRIFTELRGQLGVRNLANNLDLRADARVRFVPPCAFSTQRARVGEDLEGDPDDIDCRFQSGTYGTNEFEVRELYVKKNGASLDLQGGRQYVAEIAATKIDGVKAQYDLDGNWSLIGFGGLAPSRISRSVIEDYDGGVLPLTAGVGGAYRFDRYFGSMGAAGIVPISGQNADAAIQPRTFVTSNGYWRPSDVLDIYHYLSMDVSGPSTEEISDLFTNVSLGLNVKPTEDLRLTAAFHHFSTDTLEEFALERLEQRDPMQGIVQNNVDVLRMAAQSARLGVSLALLEKRFEVSTSFAVRHRLPETVCPADDPDCAADMGETSSNAWSGEAMLGVVDRQSIGGLRLGASVINMFGLYDSLGLGDESYGRSNHLVARLDASRELMEGQMQIDGDLSYLHAEDIGSAGCADRGAAPLTCYGDTFVNTISGGGTLFYRFSPDWFGMLTSNVALQTFQPNARADNPGGGPYTNTLLTAFLRLAYRF
jgi:hypothetical protein